MWPARPSGRPVFGEASEGPGAVPRGRASATEVSHRDDGARPDPAALADLAVRIVEHVGEVFRHGQHDDERKADGAENGDGETAATSESANGSSGSGEEQRVADRADLLDTRTKSSEVDPVTRVDIETEDLIRGLLADLRPGDAILGEEGGGDIAESGITWIADPVDGTVNLLYGLPLSAVSLGVVVDGEFVAGAVHALSLGETYAAHRGGGAWHRREEGAWRRLRASAAGELGTALVATGFSYDADVRRQQGEVLADLLPRVRDIRRLGAAALDLCHLAAGRVDAYFERGIKVWDYAAGIVIAREAGADVRVPGSPAQPFVAAPPALFGQLSEAVGLETGE